VPVIEYHGAETITKDGARRDGHWRDNGLDADLADAHQVRTGDMRHGGCSDAGARRAPCAQPWRPAASGST
jgi:hypothetical protein